MTALCFHAVDISTSSIETEKKLRWCSRAKPDPEMIGGASLLRSAQRSGGEGREGEGRVPSGKLIRGLVTRWMGTSKLFFSWHASTHLMVHGQKGGEKNSGLRTYEVK